MRIRYIVPVWLCAATGLLPAALLGPLAPAPLAYQLTSLLGYCMGAGLLAAAIGWAHLSRARNPRAALYTAGAAGLLTSALLVYVRAGYG